MDRRGWSEQVGKADSPATTTTPLAINALSHSAITPQPPAEALKRLTRLDETRKSDQSTKVAKHGFPPHPSSFGITPFSFNVAQP